MTFDKSLVGKILCSTDIVDIISPIVSLKKSGSSYKACCPFHTEKTPLFSINRQKQMYHCFGCGAGGNSINFLIEYNHLSFPQALNYIVINHIKNYEKKDLLKLLNKNNPLFKNFEKLEIFPQTENYVPFNFNDFVVFNEEINVGFIEELALNTNAFEYAKKKFTVEDIKKYSIGYAPKNDLFIERLLFASESRLKKLELFEDSLYFSQNGKSDSYSFFFKNRLTFPIYDKDNNLLGFTARSLNENSKSKYLNNRVSDFFDKGDLLYGLNLIQDNIDKIIVVEGVSDVIAINQKFGDSSVAPLGTAFTESHLYRLLKCPGLNNLEFIFDGDKAGRNAITRTKEMIERENISVDININFTELQEGVDPYDKYYQL